MRKTLPLLVALGVPCATTAADLGPSEVRLARYTSANIEAQQPLSSPLNILVSVTVPRDIATVEGAIKYLLLRTGYSLAEVDSHAAALIKLPLPENHRRLGPSRVYPLLQGLVGEPYEVSVDHVNRTVSIGLAHPEPQEEVASPEGVVITPVAVGSLPAEPSNGDSHE